MRWLAETKVDPEFVLDGASVVSLSALSPVERELWSGFSSQTEIRVGDAHSELSQNFWDVALLINDAPKSQFDLLTECARESVDLPKAFACLALGGSGFHGNRNRTWKALPGNLHFSSFCRMTLDAANCGPALSMLPTVAVTDTLGSLIDQFFLGKRQGNLPLPWIKWVNDVYLNEAKISGSLVSSQVNGDQIVSFVLGIGLNVGAVPDIADESFFGGATSLAENGLSVTLSDVFSELLKALEKRITQLQEPGGRAEIYGDYRRRLGGLGRLIELHPENPNNDSATPPIVRGRLLDVCEDLSIKVEGDPERHRWGRLRFAEK